MGQNLIDSIQIFPTSPLTSDSILFITYCGYPFTGDCTYELKLDSIRDKNLYISGKFDSNYKCLTGGANDTLNLGKYPGGNYTLYYSLIDLHGVAQTFTTSIDIVITNPSGFNNLFYEDKIIVYPNPCYKSISYILPEILNGELYLFDSFGRQVYKQKLKNRKEGIINLSNLKKGIYLLEINDNNGNKYYQKFIK